MLKKIKFKIGVKKEIISFILLVIITGISTGYYNFTKNQINNQYKEILGKSKFGIRKEERFAKQFIRKKIY